MESKELVFPISNSLEENARIWAEYYNNLIESGHGFVFRLLQNPGI
jgi:hypothetical protein